MASEGCAEAASERNVDPLTLNALAALVVTELNRVNKQRLDIDRAIPDGIGDWAMYGPCLPVLFHLFQLPSATNTSYVASKKADRIEMLEEFVDELIKKQYD